MRFLARWSVVVAFCSAVAFAAVQPALHHANAKRPSDCASHGTDAAGAPSGLKSQAAPQEVSYVGPGTAIVGSTVIKALLTSSSVADRRAPNRATSASSHALRAARLSLHLRSIPLLI